MYRETQSGDQLRAWLALSFLLLTALLRDRVANQSS